MYRFDDFDDAYTFAHGSLFDWFINCCTIFHTLGDFFSTYVCLCVYACINA